MHFCATTAIRRSSRWKKPLMETFAVVQAIGQSWTPLSLSAERTPAVRQRPMVAAAAAWRMVQESQEDVS